MFLPPGRQLSPHHREETTSQVLARLAQEGLLEGSERELDLEESLECDIGSAVYRPCDLGQ